MLQLTMMHCHTKFGYKRFGSSGHIFQTKPSQPDSESSTPHSHPKNPHTLPYRGCKKQVNEHPPKNVSLVLSSTSQDIEPHTIIQK